jgi:hypothetical protein
MMGTIFVIVGALAIAIIGREAVDRMKGSSGSPNSERSG